MNMTSHVWPERREAHLVSDVTLLLLTRVGTLKSDSDLGVLFDVGRPTNEEGMERKGEGVTKKEPCKGVSELEFRSRVLRETPWSRFLTYLFLKERKETVP